MKEDSAFSAVFLFLFFRNRDKYLCEIAMSKDSSNLCCANFA